MLRDKSLTRDNLDCTSSSYSIYDTSNKANNKIVPPQTSTRLTCVYSILRAKLTEREVIDSSLLHLWGAIVIVVEDSAISRQLVVGSVLELALKA